MRGFYIIMWTRRERVKDRDFICGMQTINPWSPGLERNIGFLCTI